MMNHALRNPIFSKNRISWDRQNANLKMKNRKEQQRQHSGFTAIVSLFKLKNNEFNHG